MTKEDRSIRLQKFVDQVHKQLIVSCQAMRTEALFGSDIMAKMAMAAAEGGAPAVAPERPRPGKPHSAGRGERRRYAG